MYELMVVNILMTVGQLELNSATAAAAIGPLNGGCGCGCAPYYIDGERRGSRYSLALNFSFAWISEWLMSQEFYIGLAGRERPER